MDDTSLFQMQRQSATEVGISILMEIRQIRLFCKL